MKEQASREIISRLDSDDYAEEETVLLKIPVTLPYPTQESDFERVNGAVVHDGSFYRLVKQKLDKDTLYIVCIPDHKQKVLANAMEDYIKRVTETPATSNKTTNIFSKLLTDFEVPSVQTIISGKGWIQDIRFSHLVSNTFDLGRIVLTPPPEV